MFGLEVEAIRDTLGLETAPIPREFEYVNFTYNQFNPCLGDLKAIGISIDGLVEWQASYSNDGFVFTRHVGVSAGFAYAGGPPLDQSFGAGNDDDAVLTAVGGGADVASRSFDVQDLLLGPGDLYGPSFIGMESFDLEVGLITDLSDFPLVYQPDVPRQVEWVYATFDGELSVMYVYDEQECPPVVPVPGALLLVGLGAGMVGYMHRRKSR